MINFGKYYTFQRHGWEFNLDVQEEILHILVVVDGIVSIVQEHTYAMHDINEINKIK